MKTLTLQLPDDVDEKDVQTLLAAKLFEDGTLSLGQAAELAGFSKRAFMESLEKYGVSLFNYTEDELEQDLQNAKGYHL